MPTTAEETVLLPERLYKELEEGMATRAEAVALHQERRSELGKSLGLNVGSPMETVILGNGQEALARDYVGLILDTSVYAKRNCKNCYGRGHVTIVKPIPVATALGLVKENPANEALLRQREPGKYATHTETMCGCAKDRFKRAHEKFVDVLIKEGLAQPCGFIVEGDGWRHVKVELL